MPVSSILTHAYETVTCIFIARFIIIALSCLFYALNDFRYQNELPKKIKSRGKDAHMVHEELVQTMRWKQIRGKFYPQLLYLIKVNTPRAVMQETKKAFRKLPNLEQAITALSNLKGVGITMASGNNIQTVLNFCVT